MATELENLVPEADVEVEGMRGPKGDKGDSYVLTEADKEEIARKVDTIIDAETDKSLTISGKPADAKAAGDEINDLKADLNKMRTATAEDVGKALLAKTVDDGKVTEWNFGEAGGTVQTDDTLSVKGMAADAKAVGNLLRNAGLYEIAVGDLISGWVDTDGTFKSSTTGWKRTDFVDISEYVFLVANISTIYAAFYDSQKAFIQQAIITSDAHLLPPEGACYIVISEAGAKMLTLTLSGYLYAGRIAAVEKIVEPIKDSTLENVGQFLKLKYANTFTREYAFTDIEPNAKNKWGAVAYWFRTQIEAAIDYVNSFSSEWIHNVWVTDMHFGNNNNGEAGNVCNYLMKTGKFDYLIYSGDILDAPTKACFTFAKRAKLVEDTSSTIFTMGNHEINRNPEVTAEDLYNYFLRKADFVNANDNFHYYVDNYQQNIRYVIINTENINAESLTKLTNALAIPSDWTAFIIGHRNVLIDNEMHRENSLNITAEQSAAIKTAIASCTGTFGGYLCGHQHIDSIDLWDDGANPPWYQIMLDSDKNEGAGSREGDNWKYTPNESNNGRSPLENIITLISINTFEKKMALYRIGAYRGGNNVVIDYGSQTVTETETNVISKRDSLIDFTKEDLTPFNTKYVSCISLSSMELQFDAVSGTRNVNYSFDGIIPGRTYELWIRSDAPGGYNVYNDLGATDRETNAVCILYLRAAKWADNMQRSVCFTASESHIGLSVYLYSVATGTPAHLQMHLHEVRNPNR